MYGCYNDLRVKCQADLVTGDTARTVLYEVMSDTHRPRSAGPIRPPPPHPAIAMSLATTACRTLAAAALLGASAGAARAQTSGTATYNGSTTTAAAFGYYVGPISETLTGATLPGQSLAVTAFCIDFANSISAGTTYTANYTSLGAVLSGQTTLANTRQGAAGLAGYKKAAYLIDQFQTVAGLTGATRDATWGALQGALWSIFTPSSAALDASTSTTDSQVIEYWQNKANVFAASAAFNTYDYSRFTIITDARAKGVATGGVQEFMTPNVTTTPEPGSVVLLGAGLLATCGAAARRRRAVAA